MRLSFKIQTELKEALVAEIATGERSVSAAMLAAGEGLRLAWCGQITGAGLKTRPTNTIRTAPYPNGQPSLNAAALVWSKTPVIGGADDTGPLIRSRNELWLAIPLPAGRKSRRGGRMNPRA